MDLVVCSPQEICQPIAATAECVAQDSTSSRGDPQRHYFLPVDWDRFGLQVAQNLIAQNICEEWNVACPEMHGSKNGKAIILTSGLLMPDTRPCVVSSFWPVSGLPVCRFCVYCSYNTLSERRNLAVQQNSRCHGQQIYTIPKIKWLDSHVRNVGKARRHRVEARRASFSEAK